MDIYYSDQLSIDSGQLSIKKENILKGLQVPLEQVDPYVNELIDVFLAESLGISSPRAQYALFKQPGFNNVEMLLKDETFLIGRIVLSALKKSTHIAVFICTAGDEVEHLSKKLLKEGHFLEGLIVDLIGSEIAEEAAEYIHKKIELDMAGRELSTTNRYSPGYCNWPVVDQQKLFALLGSHTCGIQLTDSSLMLPIKSVSGVVGVGEDVQNRGYSCSKCDAEFCIYRDKGK